ncbi:MAG: hypothetical protein AABM67_10290 [Acidobacteriota bacterium]
MNSRDCRATRREIDESELHQRLSDPALSHVQSCEACREFQGERARLRELVGSLDPVRAPGDFDMRLRARIAAEESRAPRASLFQRFVVSTPAMAVAALLVMLAGSVVWFMQNRNQQPSVAAGSGTTDVKSIENAATPATSPVIEQAQNPAPAVARNSRPQQYRATGARGSAEYLSMGAESIKQGQQRAGDVSLSAPVKPLVVSLEDDRGAKRKISLPPVSFGSQRLVDNRIAVSSNNSRSW